MTCLTLGSVNHHDGAKVSLEACTAQITAARRTCYGNPDGSELSQWLNIKHHNFSQVEWQRILRPVTRYFLKIGLSLISSNSHSLI